MNKLQLLITDIDGTLLNTQKQISKHTLDYLIHLQQNGVVIALCSGRIPAELQSFIKQLQLDRYGGYIIHTNGVGIINCKTSDSINFSPLHLNEMQELTNLAKKIIYIQLLNIMILMLWNATHLFNLKDF